MNDRTLAVVVFLCTSAIVTLTLLAAFVEWIEDVWASRRDDDEPGSTDPIKVQVKR